MDRPPPKVFWGTVPQSPLSLRPWTIHEEKVLGTVDLDVENRLQVYKYNVHIKQAGRWLVQGVVLKTLSNTHPFPISF